MRTRWVLTTEIDWEIVGVVAWAIWVFAGVLSTGFTDAILNDQAAASIAGAATFAGMLGIPLIAVIAWCVSEFRKNRPAWPLRRVYTSSEDLRERYRP